MSPILKSNSTDSAIILKTDEALGQLEYEKKEAYAAIRELEFDENMGKISKEDFGALKKQYMLDAVHYLKKIDELQENKSKAKALGEEEIIDQIEKEISSLRYGGSSKQKDVFCVQCGTKSPPNRRFCSSCGAKI
ncbi:MAG: zinc-ribbon domain-containing protein [Desulfobacterales bacterium]|nr:zinc-ribbon domain-containing protein [Desulfobacterales bacterium]